MKKIKHQAFLVTAFSVMLVLLVALGAVSASASEGGNIEVTASTGASVTQGSRENCSVYIDSLDTLSSLIVTVYYDPSLVQVTASDVVSVAPSMIYDRVIREDCIQFSYIFDGCGSASQTQLFHFEYAVLNDAAIGDTYFDIVVSEAFDSALSALPVVGSRCNFAILADPNAVVHSYTRQVIEEVYRYSDATCTEPAVYYYCCATCDARGEETFEYGAPLGHVGGVATCLSQATCTRCFLPYGFLLDHAYTSEEATDIFLKSEATCTEKAVYYKSCSFCGEKGEETFSAGAEPSHSYRSAWSTDESFHWYACDVCDEVKDKSEHGYSNNCDTECDVCKQVREITHSYGAEWFGDEEAHWRQCSICEDKTDVAPHSWDDGSVTKEATCDEEGEKTFTCSVCSQTATESIERLTQTDETTAEADDETEIVTDASDGAETDDDKGEYPSVGLHIPTPYIAITVGIGLAVFLAIVLVVKCKNRKNEGK